MEIIGALFEFWTVTWTTTETWKRQLRETMMDIIIFWHFIHKIIDNRKANQRLRLTRHLLNL